MQRVVFAGEGLGQIRIALPVGGQIAVGQARVAVRVGAVVAGDAAMRQGVAVGVPDGLAGRRAAREVAFAAGSLQVPCGFQCQASTCSSVFCR